MIEYHVKRRFDRVTTRVEVEKFDDFNEALENMIEIKNNPDVDYAEFWVVTKDGWALQEQYDVSGCDKNDAKDYGKYLNEKDQVLID